MRQSNTWDDDDPERGSATIEFLVAGLVLLVPLVYIVIAFGMMQNVMLGTEATARYVARSLATGSAVPPDAVRDMVAAGYGLDPDSLSISAECYPDPGSCPAAGSTIVVTVDSRLTLPLMPAIFDSHLGVPISGSATYRVERLSQ